MSDIKGLINLQFYHSPARSFPTDQELSEPVPPKQSIAISVTNLVRSNAAVVRFKPLKPEAEIEEGEDLVDKSKIVDIPADVNLSDACVDVLAPSFAEESRCEMEVSLDGQGGYPVALESPLVVAADPDLQPNDEGREG